MTIGQDAFRLAMHRIKRHFDDTPLLSSDPSQILRALYGKAKSYGARKIAGDKTRRRRVNLFSQSLYLLIRAGISEVQHFAKSPFLDELVDLMNRNKTAGEIAKAIRTWVAAH